MHIHSELAQQIVDSAQTIVGWNVNFITKQGTIIASTDAKRIGMYHAAGHKAAKTKDMQIVSYTGEYEGAVIPSLCITTLPVSLALQVSRTLSGSTAFY